MSKDRLSQRHERHSIKQTHNPIKGASVDLAGFVYTDDTLTSLENDNRHPRNSGPQVSEKLNTGDLISAVNYVWDCASQPLAVLFSKTNSHRTKPNLKSDIDCYSDEEETFCASTWAYDQPLFNQSISKTNTAKLMQENLELFERNKKMLSSYESYSFWRQLQIRSTLMRIYSNGSYFSDAGRIPNLGRTCRWMSEMNLAKRKNQVLAMIDDHVTHDHYTVQHSNAASGSVPDHTTCSTNNLRISGCYSEAIEPTDLSHSVVANLDSKSSTPCCGDDVVPTQNVNTPILKIFPSSSDIDSQETNSTSSFHEINVQESVDGLHEHTSSKGVIFFDADSRFETNLSAEEKSHYSVAKQEHAFAGAMAGIVVSLCLHPMDTIKTVVQSCRANQKPLHYIGRSIISERGVTGLYRGIASNIVSSAPISAVYTFTYESVKKNLLPLLPKEYHSLAHCMAGGCASIATSFIFTPSERIKQQMQVGSHYRNSWNALIVVVQKGGLPSLYTGWGAVLCRNVPHSAIKFYTYESLKENMLPSVHPNTQANTSTTLVCGGLAGSFASLFTTPFDVAKTRLQTQIPGSLTRYNGVFNTLLDIGKHEGLKGLYRGLTPRLAMYMIQGALFFASYESFKSLLSLEIPQTTTQVIPHEQRIEDDSSTLLSLLLVSA